MEILFLTQIIPYPPDAGPRVKTWNVLRYLAQRGHHVTLASFVRPDEEQYVHKMLDVCHAVHTVPIHRSRIADVGYLLRSNMTGRPFLIERDDLSQMRGLVGRLMASYSYDVIHADQLTMTQFALDLVDPKNGKRPFTVFDAHNATWTISERMFENAPWFLRMLLKPETARIKRYEEMLVQSFDHTMVVIPQDERALVSGLNGEAASVVKRISVIPIAVDTKRLQPTERKPKSKNILTLGSLNYPPNADGIRWFANEIFPLIQKQEPDVTLTIIGKNPPADFIELADAQPDVIKVTGYVPDLTPYMEEAALMVVPVRAGSGMRVRLLEAFARAMPSVTTTIGLEGIDGVHNEHVLLADEPESFAAESLRLLQDEELQQTLAENGRLLAEQKYDWQVVLGRMDAVYARAAYKEKLHAK